MRPRRVERTGPLWAASMVEASRARVGHLRTTCGTHEVDLVVERAALLGP